MDDGAPMRFGLSGCGGGFESAPLDELGEWAAFAEELGYSGLRINEEHCQRHGHDRRTCLSPIILATALAARTRRIRLGFSVLLLALHHPVLGAVAGHITDLETIVGRPVNRSTRLDNWCRHRSTVSTPDRANPGSDAQPATELAPPPTPIPGDDLTLVLSQLVGEQSRLAEQAGRATLLAEQLLQSEQRYREAQTAMVTLAGRNGWLESKLEEREALFETISGEPVQPLYPSEDLPDPERIGFPASAVWKLRPPRQS